MWLNICTEQCNTNCHCDSNRNATKTVNIFSLDWTRRQIFRPPDIPQSLRRAWQPKDKFCKEYQITDVWSVCHLTLSFSKVQSTWCNYKQNLYRQVQWYFYFRQTQMRQRLQTLDTAVAEYTVVTTNGYPGVSSVRCLKQILSSLLLEADMCADLVSSWVVFGVTFGIRSEHSNFSVNSQHFLLPLKCPSHVIERNTLWHFILCNTWQILCAIN